MLKMKSECEKCNAKTPLDGTSYICSFECSFCESCTTGMNGVCPNCSGELLRRPKRAKKPTDVAVDLMKKKVQGVFSSLGKK
ncbi:MAG: DUF1272 domain-containing protein [Candidatus Saccharibacteria bacterium]|nr:DUF1272 domain-containing protein [Moraxellaceae bacterium]